MEVFEMGSDRSAGDRITFFLIGAGIGATLAMLFAPKSGRELRRDIADVSRKTYGKGADTARRVGERVAQGVDVVRGAADRTKGQIQEAYESGKQSYREERDRTET
jgi:gas vesicle protein